MKNIFDVVLMIWLSMTILLCLILFSEEVFIRQQSIHIRNKVNEIVEINSGYTEDAEIEVNELLSKTKYESRKILKKNYDLDSKVEEFSSEMINLVIKEFENNISTIN